MIGNRIKQRRVELGMTQSDLAKKLGYKSKSTIGKIETNVNDIPLAKVEEFAVALNTTSAFLMGWEEEYLEKKQVERIKELFLKLNSEDRARIEERMSSMLESENYNEA